MTPARRLRTQDEEVEAEKAPEGILRNELNRQIKPKSKTENNKSYICRANKIKPNRLVRSSSQGGQSRAEAHLSVEAAAGQAHCQTQFMDGGAWQVLMSIYRRHTHAHTHRDAHTRLADPLGTQ